MWFLGCCARILSTVSSQGSCEVAMQVTAKSGKRCVRCQQLIPMGGNARWSTLPDNAKGDMEHDPSCPSAGAAPPAASSSSATAASTTPPGALPYSNRTVEIEEMVKLQDGRERRVLCHVSEPLYVSASANTLLAADEFRAWVEGVKRKFDKAVEVAKSP